MSQPNFKDLTGQKFGRLTVLSRCENTKYGQAQWLCECTCGKKRKVMSWCLTKYKVTHCGNCPNPYTNYDKIRKMTVDKLAEYFATDFRNKFICQECEFAEKDVCSIKHCIEHFKQYLLQEVEE